MTLSSTHYGAGIEKGGVMIGTVKEVMTGLADGNIHAHQIVSITLSGTTCTAYYLKP
jgi:hypothetical protein